MKKEIIKPHLIKLKIGESHKFPFKKYFSVRKAIKLLEADDIYFKSQPYNECKETIKVTRIKERDPTVVRPNITRLKVGESYKWPLDRYSSVRSTLSGINNGNYYRTSACYKKNIVIVTRVSKEEYNSTNIKPRLLKLEVHESCNFDLDKSNVVKSTISQMKIHSTTKHLRFKTETQEEDFNVKRIK